MDDFTSQYQWTIIEIISGILSITFLFSVCTQMRFIEPTTFMSIDQTTQSAQVAYNVYLVDEGDFLVDNAILSKGCYFNWKDYVHVYDDNHLSLIDFVSVNGEVDTQNVGEYLLTYTLRYNGTTIIKQAIYYVEEVL